MSNTKSERKKPDNEIKIELPSYSVNENMARSAVASFIAQLNPKLSEIADIKCAVSEAVTNCIVHGYKDSIGKITISVKCYSDRTVKIEICDKGCGIADIEKARTPLFTTDSSGERSGMGFSVMENFMDKVTVKSGLGKGTRILMTKKLSPVMIFNPAEDEKKLNMSL